MNTSILVVDDDDAHRGMLRMMLQAWGYSVDEAADGDLAVEAGQVSISMLQRRLRVGYARAGRLVDEMTLRGITAEAEGPTKPRTVLISREEWRRMQENGE